MQAPLAFGEFVLDPARRQLTRRGVVVRLTRKAFDLLMLLAARRPEAVSQADIRAALWADAFVAENSLAAVVFELRTALGESARQPRFLRTVHGFGYAFEAEAPLRQTAPAGCRLVIGDAAVDLGPGEHLVGRSRHCAIRFQSVRVSRIHARLTVSGAAATVEDLQSRNGTFLRGERLAQPAVLTDGDELVFGSELARFEASESTALTEASDA